jgi:NAD+ kinase
MESRQIRCKKLKKCLKFGIFFNNHKKKFFKYIVKPIIENIEKNCSKAFILFKYKNIFEEFSVNYMENTENIIENCDIILIIGGDGTVIYYSKIAANFDKQIFAINQGRIGFLAEHGIFFHNIKKIVENDYKIQKKMLLEIFVNGVLQRNLALNDVVIARSTTSPIIDFEIFQFEKKIYNLRADSVIVTTPTGSTAYSLSAGGAIIGEDTDCIGITPVASSSFYAKPIVLNANNIVTIECKNVKKSEIFLLNDGKFCFKTNRNLIVNVKKSDKFAKFITFNNKNNFEKIQILR